MNEIKAVQSEFKNASHAESDESMTSTISGSGLKGFSDSQAQAKKRARVSRNNGGQKRITLTRERVVARARQMLEEEGFEKLSLRSLAARLGVTAPALYGHVRDKKDLLERVGEDGYARLAKALMPMPEGDPIKQIHHFAQTYLDFARDNHEQFRTMMLSSPEVLHEGCGDHLGHAAGAFREAAECVARAVALGKLECHDLTQTNLSIWGTVYGVTKIILATSNMLDRDQQDRMLNDTVAAILRGMEPTRMQIRRIEADQANYA